MNSAQSTLYLCRPGFEKILQDEIKRKAGCTAKIIATGTLAADGGVADEGDCFIFEVGRLLNAAPIPADHLKPVSHSFLSQWIPDRSWSLHCFSPDPSMHKRVGGLQRAILRTVEKTAPEKFRCYQECCAGQVLQICYLPDSAWAACSTENKAVNLEAPRMRMDPRAPSRSYLKLEEAFLRMGEEPGKGQKAIDLGAAPGGWTYALIRRGCDVIAVDHGPLKLPRHEKGWGKVSHVGTNGITYMPERREWPVDWMVADMLVAPGVALGLMRRWLEVSAAKRIVCNIKLPQKNPAGALVPVEKMLQHFKSDWQLRIYHLYHDRREVTVCGQFLK